MFKRIDTSPIISVEVFEVVKVRAFGGEGTEECPHQIVTYYFDKDGEWLATANTPIKIPEGVEE